jgi:hypothetical protein
VRAISRFAIAAGVVGGSEFPGVIPIDDGDSDLAGILIRSGYVPSITVTNVVCIAVTNAHIVCVDVVTNDCRACRANAGDYEAWTERRGELERVADDDRGGCIRCCCMRVIQ